MANYPHTLIIRVDDETYNQLLELQSSQKYDVKLGVIVREAIKKGLEK